MKTLISQVKEGQFFQLQKGSIIYRMDYNGYFVECTNMHTNVETTFKKHHNKNDKMTERQVYLVNNY